MCFRWKAQSLDYALYHADRRNNEKEVRDIRCKMEHFREAIKALRTVEKMNTPDGWEG